MTMTGKELVKKAHYIMIKGGQTVSIPVHAGKALGQGLLNKLLKQLGFK